MKTTRYFQEQVLRKRPYIRLEWCKRILKAPLAIHKQADGRIRFWGIVPELQDRVLRVVTLEDGETIHNAPRSELSPNESGRRGPAMKLHYYPDTDSLYIDLNANPSADSREVADGMVIDLDSAGRVVGIDIQHASQVLDLNTLETESFPAARTKIA